MNGFARDNEWQRRMRDAILVPGFYERYTLGGRYVLIDKGRLATLLQRRYAVDTVAQGKENAAVCIEEKIVRWPTDDDGTPRLGHWRFCLETQSCSVPGHESDGWMKYGEADYLLYCFASADECALDCHLIEFPKLKAWFWPREQTFALHRMAHTDNHTVSRLVPIAEVRANVPTKQFACRAP